MVSRQGVNMMAVEDLLEEQGRRIRAYELALAGKTTGETVDQLLESAEKILKFITPENSAGEDVTVSESKNAETKSKTPKSGLVHFAS